MSAHAAIERVYVENDWYDGPRAGIADIGGIPHRFVSNFDDSIDDWSDTFTVFPVRSEVLALEQEQWRLFVAWNRRYKSGEVGVDSHPGHGGIDPRWDELEHLLLADRTSIPADAKRAKADFVRLDCDQRYKEDGPDYALRWTLL